MTYTMFSLPLSLSHTLFPECDTIVSIDCVAHKCASISWQRLVYTLTQRLNTDYHLQHHFKNEQFFHFKMSAAIVLEIRVNDDKNIIERRFPADMSIETLKSRLELITGASAATMRLEFDGQGEVNDSKTIGDYFTSADGGDNRLGLLVRDSNTIVNVAGASDVPKYEMPDEAYEQRNDSVRMFKMKNKLGRFSDSAQTNTFEDEECIKPFKVGDRCEVTNKDQPPRRGQVAFLGKIDGKVGYFVGVRYDEPYGKNDGSVDGKR